tara:strand:- start:516 stop:878 length:363 start_codon:yes stop_codon:yes gene_type:complete
MVFFALCIAPVLNKSLDRKDSSRVLRKIFPKNFLYGLFASFVLIFVSIYYNNNLSLTFSTLIFALFITNLYILVPRINLEADKTNNKTYTKRFKKLHFISVVIYSLQIVLSLTGMIAFYN